MGDGVKVISEANSAHDIYGSYAEAVGHFENRMTHKRDSTSLRFDEKLHNYKMDKLLNSEDVFNAIAVRNHVDSLMLQRELLDRYYWVKKFYTAMRGEQ